MNSKLFNKTKIILFAINKRCLNNNTLTFNKKNDFFKNRSLFNNKQQYYYLNNKSNFVKYLLKNYRKSSQSVYILSFILGTSLGLFAGYVLNFNAQFYLLGKDVNVPVAETPLILDTGFREKVCFN